MSYGAFFPGAARNTPFSVSDFRLSSPRPLVGSMPPLAESIHQSEAFSPNNPDASLLVLESSLYPPPWSHFEGVFHLYR
jgi:hypothetical protein